MLTYSYLLQRLFRFSPRLFGLISKYFPPSSKGSFEPLLEDSAPLPEAFQPLFEDLSDLFSKLSKAYFQELPSRLPKRFSLILKTFPPTSKTSESLFSRTSESLPEALRPLFYPHLSLLPKAFPSSKRRVAVSFRAFPATSQRLHKLLSKASQVPF